MIDPLSLAAFMRVPEPASVSDLDKNPDPLYMGDLGRHLQGNMDYRDDRQAYYKRNQKDFESFKDVKKVFLARYTDTLNRDIRVFLKENPGSSQVEAVEAFLGMYRGYAMTFGESYIFRAIRIQMFFNRDLFRFAVENTFVSLERAAQEFLTHYIGYKQVFGEQFIQEALEWLLE